MIFFPQSCSFIGSSRYRCLHQYFSDFLVWIRPLFGGDWSELVLKIWRFVSKSNSDEEKTVFLNCLCGRSLFPSYFARLQKLATRTLPLFSLTSFCHWAAFWWISGNLKKPERKTISLGYPSFLNGYSNWSSCITWKSYRLYRYMYLFYPASLWVIQ